MLKKFQTQTKQQRQDNEVPPFGHKFLFLSTLNFGMQFHLSTRITFCLFSHAALPSKNSSLMLLLLFFSHQFAFCISPPPFLLFCLSVSLALSLSNTYCSIFSLSLSLGITSNPHVGQMEALRGPTLLSEALHDLTILIFRISGDGEIRNREISVALSALSLRGNVCKAPGVLAAHHLSHSCSSHHQTSAPILRSVAVLVSHCVSELLLDRRACLNFLRESSPHSGSFQSLLGTHSRFIPMIQDVHMLHRVSLHVRARLLEPGLHLLPGTQGSVPNKPQVSKLVEEKEVRRVRDRTRASEAADIPDKRQTPSHAQLIQGLLECLRLL
mmetsp:Transcript_35196/g.69442  ORF Transcript_35196/g.69442 Transcript_35196/m.69442 type:complete len:327 (-) Transcript_35196:349-1329(-)